MSTDKFITDSYQLKIERDIFNRIDAILLSYDRAKNIRFKRTSNFKFQPKIKLEKGVVQVTTIGSVDGKTSDIFAY